MDLAQVPIIIIPIRLASCNTVSTTITAHRSVVDASHHQIAAGGIEAQYARVPGLVENWDRDVGPGVIDQSYGSVRRDPVRTNGVAVGPMPREVSRRVVGLHLRCKEESVALRRRRYGPLLVTET